MMNETDTDSGARFLRLFVHHEPVLRSYARSMLVDRRAVDDVMQEASVVLWKKLDQLERDEGFLPWAKVVVRFEALRAARKAARDRHVFSDALLAQLADEAEGITHEQLDAEREALRHCLGKFREGHRRLLLAAHGGEESVKSLAEQAGRSANAYYKLLGRLRSRLARCVLTEVRSA